MTISTINAALTQAVRNSIHHKASGPLTATDKAAARRAYNNALHEHLTELKGAQAAATLAYDNAAAALAALELSPRLREAIARHHAAPPQTPPATSPTSSTSWEVEPS